MKFAEKLRRLTERMNKSQLSRDAGLSPTVISSYINQWDTIPRADIALRIARVLGVDVEWLVDDTADWPPVPKERPAASSLTNDELMLKLAERQRIGACYMRKVLDTIENTDWRAIADVVRSLKHDDELPVSMRRAVHMILYSQASLSDWYHSFDLEQYIKEHHAKLPGGRAYSAKDLEYKALSDEFNRVVETNKDLREAAQTALRKDKIDVQLLSILEPSGGSVDIFGINEA